MHETNYNYLLYKFFTFASDKFLTKGTSYLIVGSSKIVIKVQDIG
jgi:hypothetical protein